MTRTRKLLLAAGLLAAGYGLASLWGPARSPVTSRPVTATARWAAAKIGIGDIDRAQPDERGGRGDARLVPEAAAEQAGDRHFASGEDVESITPLLLSTDIDEFPSADGTASIKSDANVGLAPPPLLSPPIAGHASHPTTVKEYAREPRRLVDLPRGTLTGVRPVPGPTESSNGTAEHVTIGSAPTLPQTEVAAASFKAPQLPPPRRLPATEVMESAQTFEDWGVAPGSRDIDDPPAARPAPPIVTGGEPLRTHIVIDGDSLARLAVRYLDDPNRSHEIFELNQDLLESPELLPIGIELRIPSRALPDRGEFGREPWEASNAPRELAAHGLVPVRPVPAASTLAPRARLVGPIPPPSPLESTR